MAQWSCKPPSGFQQSGVPFGRIPQKYGLFCGGFKDEGRNLRVHKGHHSKRENSKMWLALKQYF